MGKIAAAGGPFIHAAWVSEIAPKNDGGGPPPAPPSPPSPPSPPPPPPSPGTDVDPHGTKTIHKIVGAYRTDFNTPKPSDSIRWNVQGPPMNQEFTGYFKGSGTSSNTVDIKLHGGKHSKPDDRPGACCYIITVPLKGGDTYLRTECPHPDYEDATPRHGAQMAKSLGNAQWRGYKAAIWNKANGGVHMELWEDQGNNDGTKPANQWIQLFKFDHDPGQTAGRFTAPLTQPRSGPTNSESTFRIDDDPNTQAKWLSLVEIVPET